jgi:hypothetical protein
MYEFTGLTAEECPNAAILLQFDAVSYCCPDVSAPDNCSICGPREIPSDPDTQVETEFFGTATCGTLATHATYLPNVELACQAFLFGLELNNDEDCCEPDPNAPPTIAPLKYCEMCGEGNVVTIPNGSITLPDGILGGGQSVCGVVDSFPGTLSAAECARVQRVTLNCGCAPVSDTIASVETLEPTGAPNSEAAVVAVVPTTLGMWLFVFSVLLAIVQF